MEGQTNTSFRQWLGTMEPWQWAQSFDEGFRYGQMTTNLVEGVNAVLLKTRHLPIAFVFSATFYKLATSMPRIGQQQVDQIEAGHVFVEDVRDAMVANCQMAEVPPMTFELVPDRGLRRDLRCRPQLFRIHNEMDIREKSDVKRCELCRLEETSSANSYGVDIRNRRCDCRRFETLYYPSTHVMAACAKVNLNVEQFVNDVYTLERTLRV
ncbi:hypothetical protein GOBAR_DD12975 [Gossypium barbadense]|nr:hypothetical protein GOBAR_DD12975 [Gossypium barbadense]